MNSLEWRAVIGLGALYALRMLGMFMILPVFALYAQTLDDAVTPMQVGLAIGIYGITQAALQIPLGWLSDRIGRKPVIVAGMLMFAFGSVVAGLAESFEWIVVGRALQGAGAISSAVSALVADVTRESVRTTAMAILGAGMGFAFLLALITGPIVAGWIGVDGIFLLTAVLAVLSLPVVLFAVPTPAIAVPRPGGLRRALTDPQLLRLDAGIFVLHACLAALFTVAPLAVADTLDLPAQEHWKLYLPVMVIAILPVFPLIRWTERRGHARPVFLTAVLLLALALGLAGIGHGLPNELVGAMLLFFLGFNYLEAALPSMISRRAPPDQKGAALGLYSIAQFLGAPVGGLLGGYMLQHWGMGAAFLAIAALPLVWLSFAWPATAAAGEAARPT